MSDVVFVKYCPLCGTENPRQQAFCSECLDGDLTTVPVEPRRKNAPARPPAPPSASAADAEPASPAREVTTAHVEATPVCTLESLDNADLRFEIFDGQTVGRTEKADIQLAGVPKLDWISSAHARFVRKGDQWYVQHIGTTNFIKVDGEMYRGQEEVAIYDGSILVLSLAPFRVTLGGAKC